MSLMELSALLLAVCVVYVAAFGAVHVWWPEAVSRG